MEHYINYLVLEFGRYYKISKENIEKAYQIALSELGSELAAYFAVHSCIKTIYIKDSDKETKHPPVIFQDFYKLSKDAVRRMKTEIKK
ncbi:MAG: hypothetical protein [Bacteriophage sp.]|nr:MAG: hypothetical protein [Bacteriophage sp.]UVM91760.1 MAG: hypothetical protein [Bacteriophage sp.]